MKVRNVAATISALVFLLLFSSPSVFSQGTRGSTGAIAALNNLSTQLTAAHTMEYASTVHTLDSTGLPLTFYVHAKLRKPGDVRVTVSSTGLDATDALLFVGNAQTVSGFDPQANRYANAQPSSGRTLVVPFGFSNAEPAFATVRRLFDLTPFDSLLPGDTQNPLTLTRHGLDLPGTVLITSQMPMDMVGYQRLARLWVNIANGTPRRLETGEIVNGTEHLSYIEDFQSFTLNPSFTDDIFHWTPPSFAPVVSSDPVPPPSPKPKVGNPKPVKPKKPVHHRAK